jgi:GNAT superfamily N-acetyltransferase
MPKANAPSAPCVVVWLSVPTTTAPGARSRSRAGSGGRCRPVAADVVELRDALIAATNSRIFFWFVAVFALSAGTRWSKMIAIFDGSQTVRSRPVPSKISLNWLITSAAFSCDIARSTRGSTTSPASENDGPMVRRPGGARARIFSAMVMPMEELGERAAALIPQINPGARPQTIRRLLEQGATCYAARRGGRIVHYRWYTSQPVWLDFLQLRWVPQPGDYTTLSAFTIPEYRGRGLSRRYSDAGLARARASGLKRAVFTVAWWNVPAVVLERDRTATRVGDVTLWKLGPWRVHSRSGAVTIEGADLTVDRQNA